MVRINLLPAEITEKRRFERRFGWVILGGVVVFSAVAVTFFTAMMIGRFQAQELQGLQDEAAGYQKQAEAYKVFEDKQTELSQRQNTVTSAMNGRIDWARLTSELSLILPSDVWLETLQCDEENGLTLQGRALDGEDVPDRGFKPLAALLVRLTSLEQLSNVWLTSSSKEPFGASQRSTVSFVITTNVKPTAETSGAPAPPATSAQ